MPTHQIVCNDCNFVHEYEALAARKWRCAGCDAVMDRPPSLRQLSFASDLGIADPHLMTSAELSDAITEAKRAAHELDVTRANERRASEMISISIALQTATAQQLWASLSARNSDFVLLHAGRNTHDASEFLLTSNITYERALSIVERVAYLLAIGQWNGQGKAQAATGKN